MSYFSSQLISNNSRCHNNKSTPVPIRVPATSLLLFSSGFLLILHWRGMNSPCIYSHFQWIEVVGGYMPGASNQVPTVAQPFQMAQEWIYPKVSPRFLLIPDWGGTDSQAFESHFGDSKLWKGAFQVFSFRSKLISNNCQWHSNKSTPIPFLISREFALEENWILSCWF